MKRFFTPLLLLLLVFTFACSPKKGEKGKNPVLGLWRGTISLQGQTLPFHFRLSSPHADSLMLTLINGTEELEAGLVTQNGDTLIMPMHIFDAEIRAVLSNKNTLTGHWSKLYAEDYILPFHAQKGESHRFKIPEKDPAIQVSGKWSVAFMKEDSSGTPNAVGQFVQNKSSLTGTFLTPTGDYRFLEGNVAGDSLYLSAFDGEHAYLFKAKALSADSLAGIFWSGKTWEEKWVAVRNDSASLTSPDSLTFLKDGHDRLKFTFPDLEGKPVSLDDPKYQNKVVIVQLLGTWCPNCMDETRFLADWYNQHQKQDVAIIGLAYEKKDDYDYAKARLLKMKEKLEVGYDLLVAGSSDKEKAAATLPMLNHVMAFPTTIFIDKTGAIRRIHTGFTGPGTGEAYERFKKDFDAFVNELIEEQPITQQQ